MVCVARASLGTLRIREALATKMRTVRLTCLLVLMLSAGCAQRHPSAPGSYYLEHRGLRLRRSEEEFCQRTFAALQRDPADVDSLARVKLFVLWKGCALKESLPLGETSLVGEDWPAFLRSNADLLVEFARREYPRLSVLAKEDLLFYAALSSQWMSPDNKKDVRQLIEGALKAGSHEFVRYSAACLVVNTDALLKGGVLTEGEQQSLARHYLHDSNGEVSHDVAVFLARRGDKKALRRLIHLLPYAFVLQTSERAWRANPSQATVREYRLYCMRNLMDLFDWEADVEPWFPAGWVAFVDENYERIKWNPKKRKYHVVDELEVSFEEGERQPERH